MSSKHSNTYLQSTLTTIPPKYNKNEVILKADSGASKTYIRPQDQHILNKKQLTTKGNEVTIPNGTSMTTTTTGILPLHPSLSYHATIGNVLKGLNNVSLLSLGQLCDDDCIAVLDKRFLTVYKKGICILKGSRNWTDGLWDVRLKPHYESANVIIRKDQTKPS